MRPHLSVVVVAYDMARELPRTLGSLSATHQRGIEESAYEVIVVDNGSPTPVDPALIGSLPGQFHLRRIDAAPASPARAANTGLAAADGNLVGLIIDGARMASPGLLATARLGAGLAQRAVVASHGWNLGTRHTNAAEAGYDQSAEDQLLANVGWERDGYGLFGVSVLARSSGRGMFAPMGESSALFMSADSWQKLGGLDERFALPGGGLVNHDLLRRACELERARLVVLLGEGTFHQIHGGAATSRRYTWDEMHAEYRELTGRKHRPPDAEPLYVGAVPPATLDQVRESADLAIARQRRRGLRADGGNRPG